MWRYKYKIKTIYIYNNNKKIFNLLICKIIQIKLMLIVIHKYNAHYNNYQAFNYLNIPMIDNFWIDENMMQY